MSSLDRLKAIEETARANAEQRKGEAEERIAAEKAAAEHAEKKGELATQREAIVAEIANTEQAATEAAEAITHAEGLETDLGENLDEEMKKEIQSIKAENQEIMRQFGELQIKLKQIEADIEQLGTPTEAVSETAEKTQQLEGADSQVESAETTEQLVDKVKQELEQINIKLQENSKTGDELHQVLRWFDTDTYLRQREGIGGPEQDEERRRMKDEALKFLDKNPFAQGEDPSTLSKFMEDERRPVFGSVEEAYAKRTELQTEWSRLRQEKIHRESLLEAIKTLGEVKASLEELEEKLGAGTDGNEIAQANLLREKKDLLEKQRIAKIHYDVSVGEIGKAQNVVEAAA